MNGLTARQQECLDLIPTSIAERGYPPTLREIGRKMDIASTNGVSDMLRAMERKGAIERALGSVSRGIRVPHASPPARCPMCRCTGACGRSQ